MPKSWTETEGEMSDIELQAAKEYAERFQGGNSVSAFRWLATIDALRAERDDLQRWKVNRTHADQAINNQLNAYSQLVTEATRERDEARAERDCFKQYHDVVMEKYPPGWACDPGNVRLTVNNVIEWEVKQATARLTSDIAKLGEEVRARREECEAAREKHSSEVNMHRKDSTACFRRWHNSLKVSDAAARAVDASGALERAGGAG